jgi:hypothetical protein
MPKHYGKVKPRSKMSKAEKKHGKTAGAIHNPFVQFVKAMKGSGKTLKALAKEYKRGK